MNEAKCKHCDGTGLEQDSVAIGKTMREAREKSGQSGRETAKRMGISAAYLSDLKLFGLRSKTRMQERRRNERIPLLLGIPARIRWLSVEPLIGPIDLRFLDNGDSVTNALTGTMGVEGRGQCVPFKPLDWVVVGGESGPKARPCNVGWVRDIVGQCNGAGVPVFVKQDAGRKPGQRGNLPDDLWNTREYPKWH